MSTASIFTTSAGWWSARTIYFPPCTPYGVQCLLEYENIPIEGQNVVVVGASNIVGKPMALMLMAKEATVSRSATSRRGIWRNTRYSQTS